VNAAQNGAGAPTSDESVALDSRLANHFALVEQGDGVAGDAPRFWAFGERIFGGYTAAATLLAAARWAPQGTVALTTNVSFLSPTEVGPYRVEVTDVRPGRSSGAVNARLVQDGKTRVTLSALFIRPDLMPPAKAFEGYVRPVAAPDHCPTTWRDSKNPFDIAYRRRAVRYPGSRADYPAHGPYIELWIRMLDLWSVASPLQRQAADLLMLDAHMAETIVDAFQADPRRSFSIDLSVRWSDAVVPTAGASGPPGANWQRLRVLGEADGMIGVVSAQLLREHEIAAQAIQHVVVGPRIDSGG